MAEKRLRVGVIGAGSLLGKEVAEEIANSALGAAELVLFDQASRAGQVTTTGDEATFIQRLEAGAMHGLDFVFFAGSEVTTREHWKEARATGATIIDLTGALVHEPEVIVWSPWLRVAVANGTESGVPSKVRPDLKTAALVTPNPVSLLLALVTSRLSGAGVLQTLAATILQPASEQGSAGMDELHQQTVSLLSFHDLPRDLYDAQTAFNLLADVGSESKLSLEATEQTIRQHFSVVTGSHGPELSLQLLQAPVFHGYAVSLYVAFEEEVRLEEINRALIGPHVDVVFSKEDSPSNLTAAGHSDLLVRVRPAHTGNSSKRYWLWIAADNLKLAAANAVESALFMRSLRPLGKVQ